PGAGRGRARTARRVPEGDPAPSWGAGARQGRGDRPAARSHRRPHGGLSRPGRQRVRPAARSPVRRRARAAGTGGALGRRAEPPPAPLGGEPPDLAGVERRPDRPAARFAPPAPAGPGPPVAAGLLPLLP